MPDSNVKYDFGGQRGSLRTWALRGVFVLSVLAAVGLLIDRLLPDSPQRGPTTQTVQPARPPAAPPGAPAPAQQQRPQVAPPAQPAPAQPAQQQPAPTVRNFDDWAMLCDRPAGATRDVCFVYQQISLANGNQRLLLTRAGQPNTEGTSTLAFTLPLGSRLTAGMAMKVDENPQIQGTFQVCLADGCVATYPLDAGLLQQMNNGKQAVVALIDHGNGQQVNVNVSLKGFAAAYKALPNPPPPAPTPAAAAPAANAARPAQPPAQPAARQPTTNQRR